MSGALKVVQLDLFCAVFSKFRFKGGSVFKNSSGIVERRQTVPFLKDAGGVERSMGSPGVDVCRNDGKG